MSSLTKPKLILYLAAIFFAGAVSGAFLGYQYRDDHRRPHGPPSEEQMIQFLHGKMTADIGLSEQQWEEILPIIKDTSRLIRDADGENRSRIAALIDRSDAQIMQKLSPEQKARMQTWIEERRRHFEEGHKGKPH